MMTESYFGLEVGNMPQYSEELVFDVECWMERELTENEIIRLKELCEKQETETMSAYTEAGYNSRKEYLLSLVEEYDVDKETVFSLASMLGPSEDFDGLIAALEDVQVENECCGELYGEPYGDDE